MDLKRFLAPFSPPTTTLIDALRYWTEQQPQEVAYYYTDGEDEETSLTYEQFDRHARAIAARLVDLGMTGERALLLYPQGLEFIVAWFGCLYAGAVAVPAFPPRRNRNMERISAISDYLPLAPRYSRESQAVTRTGRSPSRRAIGLQPGAAVATR